MAKTNSNISYLRYLPVPMLAIMAYLVFVYSPAHIEQGESVRLMYLHLPSVAVTYTSFIITFVGSVIYLRKQSVFWDMVAHSAAEIGVVFCILLLATGAIWGRPTWGTYWDFQDPQLNSTAVMLVTYLGYLGLRNMNLSESVKSKRAAILGILGIINLVITHYAVSWWRSIHQVRTFDSDISIEGKYLFTLFFSLVTFLVIAGFMLRNRFKIAWLKNQLAEIDLDEAIDLRNKRSSLEVT